MTQPQEMLIRSGPGALVRGIAGRSIASLATGGHCFDVSVFCLPRWLTMQAKKSVELICRTLALISRGWYFSHWPTPRVSSLESLSFASLSRGSRLRCVTSPSDLFCITFQKIISHQLYLLSWNWGSLLPLPTLRRPSYHEHLHASPRQPLSPLTLTYYHTGPESCHSLKVPHLTSPSNIQAYSTSRPDWPSLAAFTHQQQQRQYSAKFPQQLLSSLWPLPLGSILLQSWDSRIPDTFYFGGPKS